jgi:hypothetical protein
MIRLAVATIALMLLICSCALAQDSTPRVQVFGGYSLVNADKGKLTPSILDVNLRQRNAPFSVASNFTGWNAEAQYNTNRWFGIVADFGGRYGSPVIAATGARLTGLPRGTAYSVLAGPVISFRNKSRLTPFVHALFGFDRASLGASTISGGTTPVPTSATTFTDAAVLLGGGLDYRVSRHFALRLAQLDEFYTTHNLNKFYNGVFNTGTFNTGTFVGLATHERNLRVSTGLMVSF